MKIHWSNHDLPLDIPDDLLARLNALIPDGQRKAYHYIGRDRCYGGPVWWLGGMTPITWPQVAEDVERLGIDIKPWVNDLQLWLDSCAVGSGI